MTSRLTWCIACVIVLAGCGVQSGDDVDAAACTEVKAFFEIKRDADALDQEMVDLRPTKVTPATVKALAPRYRDASEQYGDFLDRATSQLTRARSAESDFENVWTLMTESMTIRRDGFDFFADTFADPQSLTDPGVQDEAAEWESKTLDINERVDESSSQWLRDHDFEETDDGNFIIDC